MASQAVLQVFPATILNAFALGEQFHDVDKALLVPAVLHDRAANGTHVLLAAGAFASEV